MNYERKKENTFYPSNLTDEWSPNLPKNFPKNKIPENICEKEFILLLKCGLHFGYAMQCPKEHQQFLTCKKERDLKLFNDLKIWEQEQLQNMNKNEAQKYYNDLKQKMETIKSQYDMIPDAFAYTNKKQRYQSDIDQLNWRLGYLKKHLPANHIN